nr:CatB-related O-acetyltransferase [Aquisalinus flavus]
MGGFSTYPFNIFGGGWEEGFDPASWAVSYRGDTVVGHDVWIGRDVRIMPGVTIGNGAIIATSSVVTRDIPAFAIAGGNPAEVIKTRFDDTTIKALQEIAWWYWDAGKISRNLNAIRGADLDALRQAT